MSQEKYVTLLRGKEYGVRIMREAGGLHRHIVIEGNTLDELSATIDSIKASLSNVQDYDAYYTSWEAIQKAATEKYYNDRAGKIEVDTNIGKIDYFYILPTIAIGINKKTRYTGFYIGFSWLNIEAYVAILKYSRRQ